MPEEDIHHPHDKLFKAGFSDPAHAGAFLRSQLPEVLSSRIAWDALQLEPGSYVDSQFRESESDLLFCAPFGENAGLLYLLFEHQRSRDPWMGLRLLRYMIRIWESWRRNHPDAKRLPVILPIVLAQNEGHWGIATRFRDLLDIPPGMEEDLGADVPDFRFRLIELSEMPFQKIVGTPEGILILRVLKADVSGELLGGDVWDEALLAQVSRDAFELVLRYLLSRDIDMTTFRRKVKSIQQAEVRKTTMTLAEQIRQEGLNQGLSQGRQEGVSRGRQEDVIEVLEIRFGEIPEGLKTAISEVQDTDHLKHLHREAIRCADVESFTRAL